MARKTAVRRFAECGGLAALALAAVPVWSPAGIAQEKEEERIQVTAYRPVNANARPILGVYLATSTNDDGGLRITRVMEDWPAEGVGIREGDIIVSIEGHNLAEPLGDEPERGFGRSQSLQRLRALLKETPEGEEVEVTVHRDGETLTFAVVPRNYGPEGVWSTLELELREHAERFRDQYERVRGRIQFQDRFSNTPILPSRSYEFRFDGGSLRGRHGLDLVELNPELGSYFGAEKGILVADIEDDSPLGLLPGDVVVAVDGRQVDDIARLHRILGSYEDDEEIGFRIWRDGAETTVKGTIN